MMEARRLEKLGLLSGEDLYLSSWWSILAAKLSVYGRMDLVADMAIYAKRVMRPNTFDITFPLFYLS